MRPELQGNRRPRPAPALAVRSPCPAIAPGSTQGRERACVTRARARSERPTSAWLAWLAASHANICAPLSAPVAARLGFAVTLGAKCHGCDTPFHPDRSGNRRPHRTGQDRALGGDPLDRLGGTIHGLASAPRC